MMANEKLKMNEVRPGEDLLSSELEAIAGGAESGLDDNCSTGVSCSQGNVETPPPTE